jgi:hypothetical protein
MTLQYSNGSSRKAATINGTDTAMRVVVEGSDDSILLNHVNNTWVTDDCEAVHVMFEWDRPVSEPLAEEDCVCSADLAATLLRALFTPEEEALENCMMPNAVPVVAYHVN